MSNQDKQEETPGVLLLQAIQLPEKNSIVVQFGPLVTDKIKTAMAIIRILAESIPQALDQERAEGRKPTDKVLRVPPGTRLPDIKH